MTKLYAGIAAVIIIAIAGLWYVNHGPKAVPAAPAGQASADQDFGSYPYECDEHVTFTMTPSADLSTITIVADTDGAYPPLTTLARMDVESGARYEGGGIVLTGHGETVTLSEGDSAINCSPVVNPDEAPLNFGD